MDHLMTAAGLIAATCGAFAACGVGILLSAIRPKKDDEP